MQLVKTSRDALLKPLSTVAGIVERRNTLPILANILLRKTGDQVSFIATDLEVQISTHGAFGVGDAQESTTVAARKLLDILRALPDSAEVSLTLANGKLTLQSGKSRFALQTLDAADFPTVSQPQAWESAFTLPQKTLKHLFNMVHFAMAQQDIRYYLNGLLLVRDETGVRAVATDGHRLAYCFAALDGTASPAQAQEVIVPRKTVMEMQRLLADTEDPVTVEIAASQIRFSFGDVELVSKLVEGKFPDYNRVIPANYTRHFLTPRESLQGGLQRAAILASDKFKGVRIQLSENQLKLSSTNAEQEEAIEEMDVEYAFEAMDMGFNVSYLLDVLANVKTEQVRWSVHPDGNASTLITLPDEESFKYVVMPMRI